MKKSNSVSLRPQSRVKTPRAHVDGQGLAGVEQNSDDAMRLWAQWIFPDDKKKQDEFIDASVNNVHKFLWMAAYPSDPQLYEEMARIDNAVDGKALRNKDEL